MGTRNFESEVTEGLTDKNSQIGCEANGDKSGPSFLVFILKTFMLMFRLPESYKFQITW